MSADGLRCTFNDPANVAALEWMTQVSDSVGGAEKINAFQSGSQTNDLDPFIVGRIAMKIEGSWYLPTTLAQFGEALDYGAAPPPVPAARLAAGIAPVSWVGGWCHAVPSTARHKEAAWALVRFLASRRAAEIIAESTREDYESKGQLFIPLPNANRRTDAALMARYVGSQPRRAHEDARGHCASAAR